MNLRASCHSFSCVKNGLKVRFSVPSRKGILKIGECQPSVFTGLCWDQIKKNSFKRFFLIYLRPPSSAPKSKAGKSPAHVNKLGGKPRTSGIRCY